MFSSDIDSDEIEHFRQISRFVQIQIFVDIESHEHFKQVPLPLSLIFNLLNNEILVEFLQSSQNVDQLFLRKIFGFVFVKLIEYHVQFALPKFKQFILVQIN